MIDRTHLLALVVWLRLRLLVLVFAVVWAIRWYQACEGLWMGLVVIWVGVWVGRKWWKRRKHESL